MNLFFQSKKPELSEIDRTAVALAQIILSAVVHDSALCQVKLKRTKQQDYEKLSWKDVRITARFVEKNQTFRTAENAPGKVLHDPNITMQLIFTKGNDSSNSDGWHLDEYHFQLVENGAIQLCHEDLKNKKDLEAVLQEFTKRMPC